MRRDSNLLERGLIRRWCIAALTVAAFGVGRAEDRLQHFRSDGGVAPPGSGPFPDRLDAGGTLQWRVPMDSGHSTPVASGGRVFLTTYNDAARELATVALDRATGRVEWRKVAHAAGVETFHPRSGNPAQPTPACDGRRLYVFFGSCGLICYDLEGRQLWEHRMGPFQDEYGSGSSPVLVEDKVILQQDHDVDSVLMALNRDTGSILWKQSRPDAVRSYSTPAVWSRNGRVELLVAGALELASYDLSTGEKQWWTRGLARIVIPVPVAAGELVYMASWSPGGDSGARITLDAWSAALEKWDKNHDARLAKSEIQSGEVLDRFFRMDLDQSGDLTEVEWNRHADVFQRARNGVFALRPSSGRNELAETDVVWKYGRGAPYVASPLVDRGILWMVKDGGIVTKLDAMEGRLIQEERLPGIGNYYASPVSGDGKVYFASEPGTVSVVANRREWTVVSSHDFKEKIYATPVLDRGSLFIRTETALYRFGSDP